MISDAELRRHAVGAGVDIMVQDLDYGLGWFLAGLFTQTPAAQYLVFKGGTCLRKCYFANYRFSEDLDFTLRRAWPIEALAEALEQVRAWSLDADGPDFGAAPVRLEVVNDEYGLESFQARVYYRGPLRWSGPPHAIQLDMSRGEPLLFPVTTHPLNHRYSDAGQLPPTAIPCYDLAEMLTEKLRAISGQRRFAISRDIYDIHQLAGQNISLETVRHALPAKLAAKGLPPNIISVARLMQRRGVFEVDWERRLAHLLPSTQPVTFAAAWQRVLELVIALQTPASDSDR
jgi:predicted nucleotidyltransferase component of viral defense system